MLSLQILLTFPVEDARLLNLYFFEQQSRIYLRNLLIP